MSEIDNILVKLRLLFKALMREHFAKNKMCTLVILLYIYPGIIILISVLQQLWRRDNPLCPSVNFVCS